MTERIPDRFLIDQYLDSPEIRKLMQEAKTPQEMQKVFESRNIRFDLPQPDLVFSYIKSVLADPEVASRPDERLHI